MGILRGLVKVVVWLLALAGLALVGLVIAGLFFASELTRPTHKVPDQAVLTIDLTEGLAAQHFDLPFAPIGRPTIEDVVLGLEAAAADNRVKGVLLRVGRGPLDMAQAQEIRDAVARFQESSKPVHAFAETFGEGGDGTLHYYVAAGADQIFLQPSGDVRLMGFMLEQPFLRGAMDWLGVVPRVSKRKEYKGAPDIFTETEMPAPVKQNLQRLADSWLEQVVEGIAANRKVDAVTARRWINQAPWDASQAKQAGMVDELAYWDQASATTFGVLGEDAGIDIADYAAQIPEPSGPAPKIAIVRGNGAVVLGKGDADPFGNDGALGSDTIADAISAAIDDRVKAIIFRVDSPGGSYVAADTIWREVVRAKEMGIPVIVSFGAVAASGGYFIAAPASKIVAEPGTITGSIGVFAGKPVLTGLWNKLQIRFDGVQAGAAAADDSVNHDYSPEAWARQEARLDAIYADFTGKVAQGRGLKPEQVEAAAKGQIWSGADAQARGLVDELGGLGTAIKLAKQEAKIAQESAITLVTYPERGKQWESLLSTFMSDGVAMPPLQISSETEKLIGHLRPLIDQPDATFLWAPPIAVNGRLR
ncbi:MAG TPA: signal peptide peptidase SppA [Dongiaceae bacterium]|nr:signal peptide peptidase SppA [Dongiaceae bacterium]